MQDKRNVGAGLIWMARQGWFAEWPISYEELAPWYSHVELFLVSVEIRWSGNLARRRVSPAWEMNCVEQELQKKIMAAYHDRYVIHGQMCPL
jgi:hypothetical protein